MPLMRDSTLTLYGTVSDTDLPDSPSFSAKDVQDALGEHGAGDIAVNLNSPGGVALEGLAIFNALKSHPGHVTVNIDGIAASAASLIAMAGDKIIMREGALIMIHDPRVLAVGTSADHRKTADRLDVLASQFRAIYARRTSRSEADIEKMMQAETWLDADQAISAGFATEKAAGDAARIFACFDYSKYRHSPDYLIKLKGPITMTVTTENDDPKEKMWAGRFYRSATASGLDIASLNSIVAQAESYDVARDMVIDAMAASANANKPSATGARLVWGGGATLGNPDFFAKAVEDVLYARMSGKAPEGAARELMGVPMLELGARMLEARGERIIWSDRSRVADKIMMQHSTSDFPNLLLNSGNRILLDSYAVAESPLKRVGRRRDATDFRPITLIRLSEAPELKLKMEGGELQYGSRSEVKEAFGLKTAGRLFAITREALINDDLNAFGDSAKWWGRAAANYEADELFALFSANSGAGVALNDGTALYHSSRGNKLSSGPASSLSITAMDTARQSLRSMKGVDGKSRISVTPRHLIVGAAQEASALALAFQTQPTKTEDVNTHAGKFEVHVEPRFTNNSWRLFADPVELPTVVYAYLNGITGPQLKMREGWTTLGVEFRMFMDFGCGIEDWRGTVMSPGE